MEYKFIIADKWESLTEAILRSDDFDSLPSTKYEAEKEAVQMGFRVFRAEKVSREQYEEVRKNG